MNQDLAMQARDADDAARFRWLCEWFSDAHKQPFLSAYMSGILHEWPVKEWREAIDNAMQAEDQRGPP